MTTRLQTTADLSHQELLARLRDALNGALIGKSEIVEKVLCCLLAKGHLLFDDLPGLGKTTLAKALASAVGGRFARMQCTPDLLPGDVTGYNLFNQRTREFEFRKGPVFSDILLADEINRATPRTQSALFEAMAERQVTIDGETHALGESFFVVATQNPVESHGAFPLPEAQLDRFAMKLRIGYPDPQSELSMLIANVGEPEQREARSVDVLSMNELRELQKATARIQFSDSLLEYLVKLGLRTREHDQITLGVSPRGLLIWQRVAQAHAFLNQRDFVIPDDILEVVRPVLAVRLFGHFEDADEIISEILREEPIPTLSRS